MGFHSLPRALSAAAVRDKAQLVKYRDMKRLEQCEQQRAKS